MNSLVVSYLRIKTKKKRLAKNGKLYILALCKEIVFDIPFPLIRIF